MLSTVNAVGAKPSASTVNLTFPAPVNSMPAILGGAGGPTSVTQAAPPMLITVPSNAASPDNFTAPRAPALGTAR